ncbi:MAG: PIN domain-containing protein [Candidatus Binataceae bacterium]
MAALIDSSVFIAAERGGLDLDRVLSSFADGGLALSAITASELLHGVHRAAGASRRERRANFVEAVLSRMPVVAFDLKTARVHAALAANLARAGTTTGSHDLIIAATALANGYRVATRDLRSFPRIPGLETVAL